MRECTKPDIDQTATAMALHVAGDVAGRNPIRRATPGETTGPVGVSMARHAVDESAARKETLGHDPMKGVAVVFRAKRADRVKIVVWDGSGLVKYWKRLDGSGFKWPPIVAGVMRMNAAQLSALLAGMDWTRMHAPRIPRPKALA